MARSMLSLGMFSLLALSMAVRSRGLRIRITPAHLGGNGYFLDDLGEDLAALGISGAFFVLDGTPFIMT